MVNGAKQMNETSAPSVIDRVVSSNEAMWKFLTAPDELPHAEKLALLEAWIPAKPEGQQ